LEIIWLNEIVPKKETYIIYQVALLRYTKIIDKRVYKNKLLRRIFGPKSIEIRGQRKLHNKLHNL
jgi:hypothetical protein